MTRTSANLVLVAIAAIWGLAFIFQKTAMLHVGPFLFVAIRSTIACLVLFPIAAFERRAQKPAVPAGLWRIGLLGGAMFFLGAALQQVGIVTATVTNTGFLTGLYVVVTPVIVWFLFGRSPSNYVWTAVALAFVGIWFLGGGTIGGFSTGDLLVGLSAVFWAAHMVVIEASSVHRSPATFTAIQFLGTGTLAGICAFAFEPISLAGIQAALPELLFVGVLSSALTFTLMAVAMRHAAASEAAIIVSLETVFAAAFAAVLLGERLEPIGWVGAALLFSASLVVQGYPYVASMRRRNGERQQF